jgi:transcriptional regulator GlxA family with amidase domain
MDLRSRLGVTDEKLIGVLRAMETNLEAPPSRAELARTAGTSLRQLERLFSRHLGSGMQQHYRALRLARARLLLRESAMPIMEVALSTGFASVSQFSRAYRRTFGISPSKTRAGG